MTGSRCEQSEPKRPVGAPLGREIREGELKRIPPEPQRPAEASWRATERAAEEKRRARNRAGWIRYHHTRAKSWRALGEERARHHEEQAARYGSQREAS